MVTLRDLPFEVRLHFDTHTRILRNLTDDVAEADIDETYLTEYHTCTLEFASRVPEIPSDARLYLDGLDALVDPGLQTDDDRTYITCGTKITIQKWDDTDFPWIPGNYRVEVVWDGRSYYTVLQVRPKDLSQSQLQLMRDELERYVVGLTLDLFRRNQGIGRSELASRLPARFYQYQLLEKDFALIDGILQDIVRRPKHEAQRTYAVRLSAKSPRRDAKSYQWMHSPAGYARNHGRSGHDSRFVLAPIGVVNYDLPENRWVKRIAQSLIEMMDEISAAIESLTYHVGGVEAQLASEKTRQLNTIRALQARLRAILAEPFFQEVQDTDCALPYTPAMQRDGRYRTLYRFWRDLLNHSEVRVNASFEYQWKKTDLLWEYWALVRTIQALQQLGFEPISGWIYDEKWQFPQQIFIPVIPEGTRVVMVRGSEKVVIHYSEKLPVFRDSAIQEGALLYAEGAHNWPDIRLDYYQADAFIDSVVVEAKYRKSRNIWPEETPPDRRQWTPVMKQLQEYRQNISRTDDDMRRVVKEVIVIYPRDRDRPLISKGSHKIVLIQLMPGESDSHYVEHLRSIWG